MKGTPDENTRNPGHTIHGVLIEVSGTGVLITGEAGIGKSECALELISNGHKLVADDAVVVEIEENKLVGRAPKVTSGLLYVRGLGAIRVADVFGPQSSTPRHRIDLFIELLVSERSGDYDVICPDFLLETILGREVAKLTIPVRLGRSLPIIVETAVKIFSLRSDGVSPMPKSSSGDQSKSARENQ